MWLENQGIVEIVLKLALQTLSNDLGEGQATPPIISQPSSLRVVVTFFAGFADKAGTPVGSVIYASISLD